MIDTQRSSLIQDKVSENLHVDENKIMHMELSCHQLALINQS